MSYGIGPANSQSAYLQPEFDLSDNDAQMKDLISQRERITATCLNIREIAQYEQNELLNGQQWYFPNNSIKKRIGYRKVYPFDAITAGTTLIIATNISSSGNLFFTKIGGTAMLTSGDFIPIPYSSTTANGNVELFISSASPAQIQIILGAAASDIKSGMIVLDYLKW